MELVWGHAKHDAKLRESFPPPPYSLGGFAAGIPVAGRPRDLPLLRGGGGEVGVEPSSLSTRGRRGGGGTLIPFYEGEERCLPAGDLPKGEGWVLRCFAF